VKRLAVVAKAAGFRKVEKKAGGREVVKEANQFGVTNPFDEVLIVGLVGEYIPFADVVGLTSAVDAVDSTLLEEAVLERFVI
jgi:hypothetical protein